MTTTAPTSRLGKVTKGRLKMPWRYLFYGPEGVGKSTLAASAPRPIWLDVEDGSGRLSVARYSFRDEPGGHVPASYADIVSAIDDLTTSPHDFETLVVDTLDRVEALIWRHMLARDSRPGKKLESIEDYGFGKGYIMAVDEWRSLCARLDRLRSARGMNVILLGHAQIRTFKNPEGDDFDRWHLRANDKAAGFLKEWSDVTGFCVFDEGAGKMDGAARAKGYSTGRRLLKLERTAAYDAKSRLALPKELELDPANPWGPFAVAVLASEEQDPKKLQDAIAAELSRIGDQDLTTKAAQKVIEAKDDAPALSRILNALKAKPAVKAA